MRGSSGLLVKAGLMLSLLLPVSVSSSRSPRRRWRSGMWRTSWFTDLGWATLSRAGRKLALAGCYPRMIGRALDLRCAEQCWWSDQRWDGTAGMASPTKAMMEDPAWMTGLIAAYFHRADVIAGPLFARLPLKPSTDTTFRLFAARPAQPRSEEIVEITLSKFTVLTEDRDAESKPTRSHPRRSRRA
jgi:hypothetical protein